MQRGNPYYHHCVWCGENLVNESENVSGECGACEYAREKAKAEEEQLQDYMASLDNPTFV